MASQQELQDRIKELESELAVYRAYIDAAPVGMAILDEDRRYVQVNGALGKLNHKAPEEHTGKTIAELTPSMADYIEPKLDEVVQEDAVVIDEIEGSRNWQIHYFPLHTDGDGVDGYGMFVLDITEHTDAFEQLELRSTILEATSDLVMMTDENMTITYANSSVMDTLGYTPEEVIGQSVLMFTYVPPGAEPQFDEQNRFPPGLEENDIWEGEIPLKHKDGHPVMVSEVLILFRDEQGNIMGVGAIARDITEQNKLQNEIRESRQFLQLVLDNIPQAVFWKDKDLIYMGSNQSFAEDAGMPEEDLIGKTDYDMPWEKDAEAYRSDDRAVIESGEPKLSYEEPQLNAEGELTWLRTSKIPLRDSEGKIIGVLGTYEDITERKAAEVERERLAAIVRTSQDLIGIADMEGNTLYQNEAGLAMMGFESLDEILGRPIAELSPPEAFKVISEEGIPTALEKGFWRGETAMYGPDREVIPVEQTLSVVYDEQGKPESMFTIVSDIRDRKAAEAERERLVAIIENAPQMIGMTDLESRLTYVNPAAIKKLGYTEEEMIGQPISLVQTQEAIEIITQEAIPTALQQGYWRGEAEFITADGEVFPADQTVTVSFDEEGNPETLATIAADISERKAAQAEREQMQQEIIDAQKRTLAELSTPTVPVMEGVVVMPLSGTIDTQRSQQIMEALLMTIVAQQAEVAIVDITGVPVVDTSVANHLLQVGRAAEMLGAEFVLVGISAEVAQTIVTLGVDLAGITTRANLQSGIEYALERLGWNLSRKA